MIFLDFVKMIIGIMVNHHNQDFFNVIFLDFVKVIFFGTIAPKILLVSMTWENSPLLPAVFD